MVATVNPTSVTGAGAAYDARALRDAQRAPDAGAAGASDEQARTQAVAADPALGWRAARESVRLALADLDLSLAAGKSVTTLAAQLGEAARAEDATTFKTLLTELQDSVAAAVKSGANVAAGGTLRVQFEADAPPFEITGVDLRLKADASERAALRLTEGANAETPADAAAAARDADETLARVQAELTRLRAAAQRLENHDGFLAAAEGALASGVRTDLDAETARLLALQVRQGLSASNGAIASANPDSVLGLFSRD